MKTPTNGRMTSAQDTLRQASGQSVTWITHIIAGGTTNRYSTRALSILDEPGGDTKTYAAVLLSPGTLSQILPRGRESVGVSDDTEVRFNNAYASGSSGGFGTIEALHNASSLEGEEMRLGFFFDSQANATEEDIVWVGKYRIDDVSVQGMTAYVRGVDPLLGLGEAPFGLIIRDQDFRTAPFWVYGKSAPIIFGHCLDCQLLPVALGYSSTLDGSLTEDETVVKVTAITDFPDPPVGQRAIVIIDEEEISYAEKSAGNKTLGTSGESASPVSRGVGDTVTAFHADGATVQVKRDSYDYLIGQGATPTIENIENVRIGTRGIDSDDYSIVQSTIDGKTVQLLRMSIPPLYRRVSSVSQIIDMVDDGLGSWQSEDYVADPAAPYIWERNKTGDENRRDNLGRDDSEPKEYFAGKVIDGSDPRDGAILNGNGQRLSIRLSTDFSDERLGRLVKARVQVEYFTRAATWAGAVPQLAVYHDDNGIPIKSVDLEPATIEDVGGPTDRFHSHGVDSANPLGVDAEVDSPLVGIYGGLSYEPMVRKENAFADLATAHNEGPWINIDAPQNATGQDMYSSAGFIGSDLDRHNQTAKLRLKWPQLSGDPTSELLKTLVLKIAGSRPSGDTKCRVDLYVNGSSVLQGDLDLTADLDTHEVLWNTGGVGAIDFTEINAETTNGGITLNDLANSNSYIQIRHHPVLGYLGQPTGDWYVLLGSEIASVWWEATLESQMRGEMIDSDVAVTGKTEQEQLEEIARSSSLATQTMTFTPDLNTRTSDDPWSVFDGGLTLEVMSGDSGMSSDNAVYITNLWLELEIKASDYVNGSAEVFADIKGINEPSNLTPPEIVASLLMSAGGIRFLGLGVSSDLDASTFVWDRQPTYKFNRRTSTPTPLRQLIAGALRDGRALLTGDGLTLRYLIQDIVPGDPVAVLDKTNVISVEGKTRSRTEDVVNVFTLGVNRDNSTGSSGPIRYKEHFEGVDAASRALAWGDRRGNGTAPWMHNPATGAMPQDAATFWARRLGVKNFFITLRTTLETVNLERYDSVIIDLPRHGINYEVGNVHQTRYPTLHEREITVRIRDASAICWESDSENNIRVTSGNKAIIMRIGGSDQWALDSDGNMLVEAFEQLSGAAIVGTGVITHVDSSPAHLIYFCAWDQDDDQWNPWMVVTGYEGPSGAIQYTDLYLDVGIEENIDLSGKAAQSPCVYGTEPSGAGDKGDVYLTLGDDVVAFFNGTTRVFSIAGNLTEGIFENG